MVVNGIYKSFTVLLIAETIHRYVVKFAIRARGSAVASSTAWNGIGAAQASFHLTSIIGIIRDSYVSFVAKSAVYIIFALKTTPIN